jgi:hypothetical protein
MCASKNEQNKWKRESSNGGQQGMKYLVWRF